MKREEKRRVVQGHVEEALSGFGDEICLTDSEAAESDIRTWELCLLVLHWGAFIHLLPCAHFLFLSNRPTNIWTCTFKAPFLMKRSTSCMLLGSSHPISYILNYKTLYLIRFQVNPELLSIQSIVVVFVSFSRNPSLLAKLVSFTFCRRTKDNL